MAESGLTVSTILQKKQDFKAGVGNLFGVKGQKIKINYFTGHTLNIPYLILNKIVYLMHNIYFYTNYTNLY